jgi:hypothetical protein
VTLIITVIDKNRIVQVSDRRLTKLDGTVHDDNANKSVCIGMSGIYYAASYTGLAYMGSEKIDNRTDYWLLDHLGAITRYGDRRVESICRSLNERATSALSRLRGSYRPLEVVLAGYEKKVAFRAIVSNMKVNRQGNLEIRDRFRSYVRRFYPWSPTPEIYVAGAAIAFEADDPMARALKANRNRVLRYLKSNREKLTEERAAQPLVWLTRAAHTHPTYGHLIGRDCLSVVAFPETRRRQALLTQTVEYPAPPNKDSLFTAFYHPIRASTIQFAPHLADWYGDFMNVEMDMDPEVPEAPPDNRPIREKLGTSLASRMRMKIHNLPEGPGEED